jgi:DNA-binding response OmpR family regulator
MRRTVRNRLEVRADLEAAIVRPKMMQVNQTKRHCRRLQHLFDLRTLADVCSFWCEACPAGEGIAVHVRREGSAMDFDAALSSVTARKVLIIEDDMEVAHALARALERSGMRTECASTGAEGLVLQRSFAPDVVLVDLNLPDTDGLGLVSLLVQRGGCGVIIVSGLADAADRIVGLELGADDYIAKPPNVRELLARIRAVYRRVNLVIADPEPAAREFVQVGSFKVNLAGRAVQSASGEPISLTAAEFTAFEVMLAANGEAVSRERLSEAALHRPWRAKDRSVDQLIFNLRRKLVEVDGQRIIHSIPGAGYLVCAGPAVPIATDVILLL